MDGGGPTAGRGNAGGPREEGGGGEGRAAPSQTKPTPETPARVPQMEEEGVPSTALREVSLLQMLSESNHVVK